MVDNQKDWPDRGVEILASTVSVCIISVIFLIWRLVYGLMSKRKLLLCDYLLIVAAILNFTSTVIRFKTVEHGLGKHFQDPRVLAVPGQIRSYSYFIYLNQVLNLVAISILKYSICAYLLALKFSFVYTIIIWSSIVMVTVFNFLLPLFAQVSCTPFEANWNRAVKGKCWYNSPQGVTYMQGVSNCITDVVYIVAPIVYLSAVQLPRRTQWSLRIVFMLGLVVLICSIFKTVELKNVHATRDPTWDGVDLTIWSATEVSVGILIASLPPLRKQFDKVFRQILPSTFQTKPRTPGNSIPLYNLSKPSGRSDVQDDGDSEQHILDSDGPADGKIFKTVVHEVTSTSKSDSPSSQPKTREDYDRIQ